METSAKPRLYKIGQLARACDISRATLMRFEEDGLLTPAYINEESGYRYYDSNNLAQVLNVLKFQKLGFTKKEIRTMDNPEKIDESIRKLHHQHMLLLRELEDLTARKDKPETIQIRAVNTLGGCFFFRTKEIIYTPENLRLLAISTLEDFMDAHIAGNTHQTMKMFIEDPVLDKDGNAAGSIGQFDGRLHKCTCIIPTLQKHTGPDYMTMEPSLTLTISCRCDYNNSEDIFLRVWNEAHAMGLTPDGPVCIAGMPEIFFSANPHMSDNILRLMLRTRN